MYYNPYFEELKDERLEVVSEELIDKTKYLLFKLHPRLMYIVNDDVVLSQVDTTIIKRKPRRKLK